LAWSQKFVRKMCAKNVDEIDTMRETLKHITGANNINKFCRKKTSITLKLLDRASLVLQFILKYSIIMINNVVIHHQGI